MLPRKESRFLAALVMTILQDDNPSRRALAPASFSILCLSSANPFSIAPAIGRARKQFGQGLSGVRLLHSRHLFRRTLGHHASALLAALRSQVEDPIGIADHVHVVLDDNDAVAQVGQPMQHLQQFTDIVEMQTGGRLVQQIQRLARLPLAQLARQLDALRLAARQCHRRLSQMNVAQVRHRPASATSA